MKTSPVRAPADASNCRRRCKRRRRGRCGRRAQGRGEGCGARGGVARCSRAPVAHIGIRPAAARERRPRPGHPATALPLSARMLTVRAALRALSPVFPHLRTVSFAFYGSSSTARYRRFCGTMSALATVDTTQRLQALRKLMAKPEYNVQAVVIPTEDQRE